MFFILINRINNFYNCKKYIYNVIREKKKKCIGYKNINYINKIYDIKRKK